MDTQNLDTRTVETPNPSLAFAPLKARLKVGALVLPHGDRIFVGRPDAGVLLEQPAAQYILAALTGGLNCDEISLELGLPLEEVTDLISCLDQAQLLDTQENKISVHKRFHSPSKHRNSHSGDDSHDGAYQQLQSKLSPELSFTTWFANVRDGGISLVGERRNCEVKIFGSSRIATLLYGILLSSGLSNTSIITTREISMITEQDLCAGYFRASDIGLSLKSRTAELTRELSLFPPLPAEESNGGEKFAQQIRVAIGAPPAEQLQEWMSESIPHLLVEDPECASLNIGPLVLPGKTPCWRCVSLSRQEASPLWRDIEWRKVATPAAEVPVAVAHHIAGLIALELLQYIDIGQSQLLGSSMRVNYHSASAIENRLFTRHPGCGCNW